METRQTIQGQGQNDDFHLYIFNISSDLHLFYQSVVVVTESQPNRIGFFLLTLFYE